MSRKKSHERSKRSKIKQEEKPIIKKAFTEVEQNKGGYSIKKWFIDRCKGAVNSMAEDVIKYIIEFSILYILLQLLYVFRYIIKLYS